jgi:hypothetical protein
VGRRPKFSAILRLGRLSNKEIQINSLDEDIFKTEEYQLSNKEIERTDILNNKQENYKNN